MPHGKTLELIELSKAIRARVVAPREQRERDRSLAGKARIRARRAAR